MFLPTHICRDIKSYFLFVWRKPVNRWERVRRIFSGEGGPRTICGLFFCIVYDRLRASSEGGRRKESVSPCCRVIVFFREFFPGPHMDRQTSARRARLGPRGWTGGARTGVHGSGRPNGRAGYLVYYLIYNDKGRTGSGFARNAPYGVG